MRLIRLFLLFAFGLWSSFVAAQAKDDGTYYDAATGLTWMRCMVGQTWVNGTCTGATTAHTFDEANDMTGKVSFAGYNDWRVPNIRELTSIVDYSKNIPSLNITIFNEWADYVWSNAFANDSFLAWVVDFKNGNVKYINRTHSSGVRLVRSSRQSFALLSLARPDADYQDDGDGTVTHKPTGLMWKRCPEGQSWNGSFCTGTVSFLSWNAAKAITSTFAGKTDWRLPTIQELQSLVDYTKGSPAMNATMLANPGYGGGMFWSGSFFDYGSISNNRKDIGAWAINFVSGSSTPVIDLAQNYVRLVRNGQASVAADVPACTLATNAPASTVAAGQSVTLSANCTHSATSYRWSDATCSASSATCTVIPTATTTYSVSGSNAMGEGAVSSMTVTVVSKVTIRPVFPEAATASEIMQGGRVVRWFAAESSTGPVANSSISYQINGESLKTTVTDDDGLFSIETDPQTKLSATKSEVQERTVEFHGLGSQSFGITVATRALEQIWLVEHNLKIEGGVGLVEFEGKINKMGFKAGYNASASVGVGITYGYVATHKANIPDDGYLYANSESHSLSFSQTRQGDFSVAASVGGGVKVFAPQRAMGFDASRKVEAKSVLKMGFTTMYPDYFHLTNPVGSCYIASQIYQGTGLGEIYKYLPESINLTEFLCGTSLKNYLNEEKLTLSFIASDDVNLELLFPVRNYDPNLGTATKIRPAVQATGGNGFQMVNELTQKYKKGVKDDLENKVELVYIEKSADTGNLGIKTIHNKIGKTFDIKPELKSEDGMERKLSRTEVYTATGGLKAIKLGSTVSSTLKGSVTSPSIPLSKTFSGLMQEDINMSIETDNQRDFSYIPGMPALGWGIWNTSNIDATWIQAISPDAPATESPVKWGIETEKFFSGFEFSADLGASLGIKLDVSTGIKIAPSEKYQLGVAKITHVPLFRGESKRKIFEVEKYVDDNYLQAQRKTTFDIMQQVQTAIINFTNKQLAYAKNIAVEAGQTVVVLVKAAGDTVNAVTDHVSELVVSKMNQGAEVYLTVERWLIDEALNGQKSSAIARNMTRNNPISESEKMVGPTHFVNIKTAGVEINTIPNGATLKISGVSRYLVDAGLPTSMAPQLRLYKIDSKTASKTLVGGTYVSASDQLIAAISATGAYIMIVDTQSPKALSGLQTGFDDATGDLQVSTLFDRDLSGIDGASLMLKLNGTNVLAGKTVTSFYNPLSNYFNSIIPKHQLVPGVNKLELMVADVNGNKQTFINYVTVEGLVNPPTCTLLATPTTIRAGETTTLTASCTPVATSYVWAGVENCTNTSNTCTYAPSATSTIAVAGSNTAGIGHAVQTTVVVTTPPTQAGADGTYYDAKTGLTWMRCLVGQTWANSTCTGTATTHTFEQANAMTGKVSFAGHNDWRVPNIRELSTIVDYSKYAPALDQQLFLNAPTSSGLFVWSSSSTPYLLGSPSQRWVIRFVAGNSLTFDDTDPSYVRLVRGGQSSTLLNSVRPDTDYQDHGDGTVTHTPTGLMWKRCEEGQSWIGNTCTGTAIEVNWNNAKSISSTFAGKTDWRLPTLQELQSLVDYTQKSPVLNTIIFPNGGTESVFWSSTLWSSTPLADDSNYSWHVFSFSGSFSISTISTLNRVRLVRTLPTSDIDCLLNWAEARVPQYFSPTNGPTQTAATISYRAYDGGVYLGVDDSNSTVLAIGGILGHHLLNLGPMSTYLPAARATSCK